MYSTGYDSPPSDTVQNLEDISVEIDQGVYTFTCYRALDTGDAQDYVVELDKEFPIIWAEQSDTSSLVFHSARGISSLRIESSGKEAVVREARVEKKNYRKMLFLRHGVIMWVLWNLFAFVQLGTVRWLAEYWKYNQFIHNAVGIFTALYTILGGYAAFMHSNFKVKAHPHQILGFSFACVVIFLWVTGAVAYKIKEKEWMTKKIYQAGKLHKVVGYGFIFVGIFTVAFGIREWIEKWGTKSMVYLAFLNLLVTIVFYTTVECCHRKKRFGKDPWITPEKTMTIKEFEEKVRNGEKLWILDNIILDLSEYIKKHPGG